MKVINNGKHILIQASFYEAAALTDAVRSRINLTDMFYLIGFIGSLVFVYYALTN